MNKEKIYAYIGAMLGAGVGFGIGFGIVSFVETGVDPAEADDPIVIVLPVFALIIAAIISGGITQRWGATALVFFVVGIPCSVLAANLGREYYEVVNYLGKRFTLCSFTPLFPPLFAIPFAALGMINGYQAGRSIGKKADKSAYVELARRGQEREHLEREKSEIIAMIEKATKGKGGEKS